MLAVESRFYECRPVICRKSPTFWGFVSRSKKKNNLKIRTLCRIIGEHGFSHLLDNLQITYLIWYSVCAVRQVYLCAIFVLFLECQSTSTYINKWTQICTSWNFFLDYFDFLSDKNVKTTKTTNQNIQLFVSFSGMETKHPFGMT